MDRPLASLTQIHIEPKWIGRATEPWRHCKAGGQAKENSAACHDSQVIANAAFPQVAIHVHTFGTIHY